MGAGRRSIKLSNLSAAAPAEQAKPEVVETPVETPVEAAPIEENTVIEAPVEEAVAEETPVEAAPEAVPEAAPEEAPEVSVLEGLNTEPLPPEEEAAIISEILTEITAEEPEEKPAKNEPLDEALSEIVENNDNIGKAIAEADYTQEQLDKPEPLRNEVVVSDEVGIIAHGTKIHGDIVTDGHLEINGIVEGSINARGNVRVNGDVYGDITCGNLIIKEGVLKINVQAREDIALGEAARIEGDIKCRKIGIEGTVVGNITALETVQIAPRAVINGNIKTTAIAVGMGAKVTGNIDMGE